MESVAIKDVMRIINPLSVDLKLELLTKITESLKHELYKEADEKDEIARELFGAWRDMPEDLGSEIVNSRTISNRTINLD